MIKHYMLIVDRRLRVGSNRKPNDDELIKPRKIILPPYACASAQSKILKAKKGDVFWLLGRVRFGASSLPPMLVARLQAKQDAVRREHLVEGEFPDYFLSTRNSKNHWSKNIVFAETDPALSQYYAWNDFWPSLKKIKVEQNEGKEKLVPRGGTPGSTFKLLQAIRTIKPESILHFENHAANTLKREKVFLSYRWKESTHLALELTRQLNARGYSVWLDRCSLPRQVSSGSNVFDDEILKKELRKNIANCRYLIALKTKKYSDGVFTKIELSEGLSLADQAPKKMLVIQQEVPNDRIINKVHDKIRLAQNVVSQIPDLR